MCGAADRRAVIRRLPKGEAYSIDKIREDPKGDLWVEWRVLEGVLILVI